MNDNRGSKAIAVIALAIAIVGLGIGFAAFSSTLTISSSATVTPDENVFVNNIGFDTAGANSSCTKSDNAVTVDKGTVALKTITGLSAGFTEPGQYVVCTYNVNNASSYLAYLKNIKFGNGSTDVLTCANSTANGAVTPTDSLRDAACATVTVTAQVGGTAFGTGGSTATLTSAANNSLAINDGSHTLASQSGTEKVFVKILYAGPAVADGSFTVSIPQIGLTYSTAQ